MLSIAKTDESLGYWEATSARVPHNPTMSLVSCNLSSPRMSSAAAVIPSAARNLLFLWNRQNKKQIPRAGKRRPSE
jgi:hypothetical protein